MANINANYEVAASPEYDMMEKQFHGQLLKEIRGLPFLQARYVLSVLKDRLFTIVEGQYWMESVDWEATLQSPIEDWQVTW